MARTMLDEYKTPRKLWPEAIETACHVINRVYLHKLLNKTSYELLTGKKPNVSYFRVFGARCWIKDPHHTSKFAPKAHEGVMLARVRSLDEFPNIIQLELLKFFLHGLNPFRFHKSFSNFLGF